MSKEKETIHQVDENVPKADRSPIESSDKIMNQQCQWGKWYDHGEKICLSGSILKCDDGVWRRTGNSC